MGEIAGGHSPALKLGGFASGSLTRPTRFERGPLPVLRWADWLPPSLKLAAFSNGDRWNGFAVPYFPLESAQELAKHMPGLRYDAARDAFLIEEEGDEGACGVFEVCTLEVDGSAVKAYPIGAGAQCWHLAVG